MESRDNFSQIRSRLRKKSKYSLPAVAKKIKEKFSLSEDQIIYQHIDNVGEKNWRQLANKLPKRCQKTVRERWFEHLSPNINHQPLSQSELILLSNAQIIMRNKWAKISLLFQGRSQRQLKNSWNGMKPQEQQRLLSIASSDKSPPQSNHQLLFDLNDDFRIIDFTKSDPSNDERTTATLLIQNADTYLLKEFTGQSIQNSPIKRNISDQLRKIDYFSDKQDNFFTTLKKVREKEDLTRTIRTKIARNIKKLIQIIEHDKQNY